MAWAPALKDQQPQAVGGWYREAQSVHSAAAPPDMPSTARFTVAHRLPPGWEAGLAAGVQSSSASALSCGARFLLAAAVVGWAAQQGAGTGAEEKALSITA